MRRIEQPTPVRIALSPDTPLNGAHCRSGPDQTSRHANCSAVGMVFPRSKLPRSCRDFRGCSPAQLSLPRHTVPRWCAALGSGLSVIAIGGSAAAEQDAPVRAPGLPSYFLELNVVGGGASVGWTRSGNAVVDQHASTVGLGVRAGWLFGTYAKVGFAGSFAWYSRVGEVEVRDAEQYADEFWLRETSYRLWAPLGVFIEFYPIRDADFFFGLAGSLGSIPANTNLPPNTQDRGLFMVGFAFEVGYDINRMQQHGPGVFLRYARWTGTQSPLWTDFPDGVDSMELTLGLRWTLRLGGG